MTCLAHASHDTCRRSGPRLGLARVRGGDDGERGAGGVAPEPLLETKGHKDITCRDNACVTHCYPGQAGACWCARWQ